MSDFALDESGCLSETGCEKSLIAVSLPVTTKPTRLWERPRSLAWARSISSRRVPSRWGGQLKTATSNDSSNANFGGSFDKADYVINSKRAFRNFFNLSVTYLVGDSTDDDCLSSPCDKGDTQVLSVDGVVTF